MLEGRLAGPSEGDLVLDLATASEHQQSGHDLVVRVLSGGERHDIALRLKAHVVAVIVLVPAEALLIKRQRGCPFVAGLG